MEKSDKMSRDNAEKESSHLVKTLEDASKKKVAAVDTGANISYSLVAGAALDAWTGLPFWGIVTSRAYSIPMNILTGAAYTWWTEKWYKLTNTKKDSSQFRKWAIDLIPFNTFQVPIYMGAVALGSLFTEGHVNWEKVQNGALHLAELSPFIAPTLRIWTNVSRKLFGVKSIAEGAYN